MSEFPLGYERVPPTTWAYLSSLLMLALYFKFTRFWSFRNVDLILVILLAPGLLMVHLGAADRNVVLSEMSTAQLEGLWTPNSTGLDGALPVADPNFAGDDGSSEQGEGPRTDTSPDAGRVEGPEGQAESVGKKKVISAAMSAAEQAEALESWHKRFLQARRFEHTGYWWLFAIGAVLLIRMLIDPMMVRRPLLEPNLSSAGLTFMGSAMLVFLIANVWASDPVQKDLYTVGELTPDQSWWEAEYKSPTLMPGPGYRPLYRVPILPTFVDSIELPDSRNQRTVSGLTANLTKVVVIFSLLAIVVGMLLVGHLHYENYWMGIGIAAMFLMLPYTVQMMGRVSHVFPAALLVWAVVAYRIPYVSGLLIGLATGAVYYPMFLLPLWFSFYWKRGIGRFFIGVLAAILVMVFVLAFSSNDASDFWTSLQTMFGMWWPKYRGLQGIWALGWEPVFRLPLIAGTLTLSFALMLWPSQKNLGALLSCSCAVMVAIQFWHGYGGGLSMAWYLPLALLTIFRPNLEDRIATNVLKENWWFKRKNAAQSRQAV